MRRYIFFLIILGAVCQTSFAQNDFYQSGDSLYYLYRLEEVVVYGARGSHNTSMTRDLKAIEAKKFNAANVADVLKFDSGITLTNGYKGESEIKLRGFQPEDILVLVDGRPINPGYYGKVDLSMIPLDNIAKIKIVKGPASVAYGANGMGGVINVISDNGLAKAKTELKGKFGDYEYRELGFNHNNKYGKFNYWLSGYEKHSRGMILSRDFEATSLENGTLRDNSSYSKSGLIAKLGYSASENMLYMLSVGYHKAVKDIPTTIYAWDSPRYWRFPEWNRFSASLTGQWTIRNLDIKSIVFLDNYGDRLINYLDESMTKDNIDYDSILENWTTGGIVDAIYSLNARHQLQAGMTLKRDLMNKKPDVNESWISHHTFTGSIFLQDNYKLSLLTDIVAGFGLHGFLVSSDDYEADSFSTLNFCPMISVNHFLDKSVMLSGSYARAVRYPNLHQLYSQTSGNPDLKPEHADKFEIGATYYFNDLLTIMNGSVTVSYFNNRLQNLIYRATKSYQFQNIESASNNGIELSTDVKLWERMSAEFNYCYIDFTKFNNDMMEYIPKHKYSALLNIKLTSLANLNYEFNYIDERVTEYETIMLSSYMIHNLNLNYKINRYISLRFEVSNLTDEYYEEELGYPGMGRRILGGFSLTH